jgi:lysophospholipase L1-like esterase
VIDLRPKVVLILAGINDIAGNTGPITLNETESNIASMAELARANGIGVVLCSVLPAKEFPWRPAIKDVSQKVKTLNAWIREYATRNGLTYLDYYTAMSDADGGLRPELARDAVHPNAAGYQVMAPLAEAAIQKTLKAPARRKHL